MEAEYWILSILGIALALVAGFIGGRMSSASQRQVESMARERDQAREEAENVRAEVNRHFEESARMFGKLASDYRTFFQQFADTAQKLGLSEGRARELLQQADPSLVSEREAASSARAAGAAGAAGGAATAGEATTGDAGAASGAMASAAPEPGSVGATAAGGAPGGETGPEPTDGADAADEGRRSAAGEAMHDAPAGADASEGERNDSEPGTGRSD